MQILLTYVPSGTSSQEPTIGRVYPMTNEDAQANGSVIKGIISAYGFSTILLIDTGSTHSFISLSFVTKIESTNTITI